MKEKLRNNTTFECDVEFDAFSLPEDASDDPELVARICELLETTVWGWCCVRVRAVLRDKDGAPMATGRSSWLGGCSFASEYDFIDSSGYYDEMCDEALDDLVAQIERIIRILGVVEKL